MWVINICRAPAEQMEQPEDRFINNAVALIWLNQECMLTDTGWFLRGAAGRGACWALHLSVVSLSNTINPSRLQTFCSVADPELWPLTFTCTTARKMMDLFLGGIKRGFLKFEVQKLKSTKSSNAFCSLKLHFRPFYHPAIISLWCSIHSKSYHLMKHQKLLSCLTNFATSASA